MFNEERKRRFIDERRDEVVLPQDYLNVQFNKTKKMENELNKDICDFTAYEIREYYKMLNVSSIQSLTVMNSQFSIYTNWCLNQSLVKDNQNHILEITYDMLNNCINKVLFDMKIVTKETIMSWLKLLDNPKDQFIILAIFEGIMGDKKCELALLKPEDINGNIATLCTGRKLEISNKLVSIIDECVSTNVYYTKGGKEFKLIDNGYIIKDHCNVLQREEISVHNSERRIYNSVKKALEMIDMKEVMTPNNIFESGKLDMIKRRSLELGISPKEYITSDYIKEVEEKYNCKIVKTTYLRKYKGYLD